MSRKNDYTDNLEYIKSLADKDNITAPDSLSEENILSILPDRSDKLSPETEALLSEPAAASEAAAAERVQVTKRTSFRKWAVAAACMLVAVFGGIQVYSSLTAPPDTVTADGGLYYFKNQSEIENLVSSIDHYSFYDYGGGVETEASTEDAAENSAPATGRVLSSEAKSASGTASEHSDTYLQVDEVDEADIIKTDGKYIYYVTDTREVIILEADKGKTRQLSRIGNTDVENYIQDIYLRGDTLVTVGYVYDDEDGYTGVVTYDISDRSNPKMIASFRQTGYIISSRMVGDFVYLVTNEYVYKGGRVVPMCTADGEFKELPAESICCVPNPSETSYIILSAMDISSGKDAKCKTSAIFGASTDIYCNDHNLYTAVTEWDEEKNSTYTRIVRARLDGVKVRFDATTRVRGRIDNQFSMDEKDGYFRIATTGERAGMDVNNLFVLDSKLKETGSVTGFARNESIRAVRYFGDKAYVITYEQIDPLFIIDLSDPASPKIEGEVKIDGFSTLLIPAGEGRLLGIGHATGDNGYGGEYAAGLKLALFDISNPSAPEVLDSREFKDMSSPAQDTHKALTVNSRDGWYAIPYGIFDYNSSEGEASASENADDLSESATEDELAIATEPDYRYEGGVLVFGADDKLTIHDQHKLSDNYLSRCVYIGDYIYALDGDGEVSSFQFSK